MTFILIKMIQYYQRWVSPHRFFITGEQKFLSGYLSAVGCRYYPSCSDYAISSLGKYGFLKGSIKSLYRILKCGPWSRGGVDLP